MSLEQFISGPYSTTYKPSGGSANPVGLTEDGFTLQFSPRQEVIDTSDVYGGSLLDAVTRGCNCTLAFTLLSYKRALTSLVFWQFTSNPAILWTAATPIGRLYSDIAGELALTAYANTPAAALGTANAGAAYANDVFGTTTKLTATYAILAPGQDITFFMDSKLRKLPFQMALLPYQTTDGSITNVRFFVPS